jgi:hypothetical protein
MFYETLWIYELSEEKLIDFLKKAKDWSIRLKTSVLGVFVKLLL